MGAQCLLFILQNKLRAFLTSLGIIFGVASVISMMAVGRGARQQIMEQMKVLGELLADLASNREGADRLLDLTMVLYGSNMGDANIHNNTNLPILLAGGGFRHGQHLAAECSRPGCRLHGRPAGRNSAD